jgi:hypothetical protein
MVMASKVGIEAFNNECMRWRRSPDKRQRLGQHLMNAFSVGESNPDIFHERDNDKAQAMFQEKYVSH